MRFALVGLSLVACSQPASPPGDPLPDAGTVDNCLGGAAQFDAPVEGEHYDPAMVIAQVTLGTFYVQQGFSSFIYDDAQTAVAPSWGPVVKDLGDGTETATWSFENLEPATRYNWTLWTLDCDLTETFFTN